MRKPKIKTDAYPWENFGGALPLGVQWTEEILEECNLNWTVELYPMVVPTLKEVIRLPNRRALIRNPNILLDMGGAQYKPHQNLEVMRSLTNYMTLIEKELTPTYAGSCYFGKYVWLIGKFPRGFLLGAGADIISAYVLMVHHHQYSKSPRAYLLLVREVSRCTFVVPLTTEVGCDIKIISPEEWTPEATKVGEQLRDQGKKKLRNIEKGFASFANHRLDKEWFRDIMLKWVSGIGRDSERSSRLAEIEALVKTGAGAGLSAAKGTAWGGLAAFFSWSDHCVGKNADYRLKESWFGRRSTIKQAVYGEFLKKYPYEHS